MWLVVLFGLEVTACLQMVTGRNLHELERQRRGAGLVDPAAIMALLEVAVIRFESSLPTTVHSVSEATGLPETAVHLMLERLADEGIMHRLDRPEAAFALAQPPGRIDAKRVMEVGFALADQASPGERSPLLRRLRNAQRAVAERLTLGDEERATV
jgi:DNA-binding IscR family transcriptional regulator